jgi:hypothetical protein
MPLDPHRGGFNADLNVAYGASPAHRHDPLQYAGQGGVAPSSSQYFGDTGQDARNIFGGMGDELMHHLINNGSMADDAYSQEEGETVGEEE